MTQITNDTPLEGTIPIVDALPVLKGMGALRVPDIGTFRSHGYSGRFPLVRLPSNKLAVNRADLPDIARLYGLVSQDSVNS